MMKRLAMYWTFVIAVVLLGCSATIPSVQSDKPVKVFLLGGQSNMVGADTAAKLKPPYNEPFSKVKIWQPQEMQWEPLSPEVVNTQGRFGPEIYFGHTIAKACPGDDIRLVKYASSGTALYDDWSPTVGGAQYVSFMSITKAALTDLESDGVDYEISGMLWLQGESDAHEKKAETYEKNLTEFISHMRAEFKTPDMPFIIARVRSYYGGETGQAKIVRNAQVKIAESGQNVTWFDTDDFTMFNEGHYDANGLADIGTRFAEKYLEIAGNKE